MFEDTDCCINMAQQVLLQTAGELFCDTTSLEKMLGRIIEQAQKVVVCKRVELFLLEVVDNKTTTTQTDPEV